MANAYVQLPDDSGNTGKKEDHFTVANGNYREAVVIGDPTTVAAVAPVSATLGLGVNILDGSNVVEGAVADVAVVGDNSGTISAKLRGINQILNDVWTSASHFLKVSIQNATLAVTQSGTWTVTAAQATAASLNATVVGTGTFAAQVTAVGTIADDSTTPGAPVMVGGFAKNPDGTDPGSVSAEDDVTRFITDRNRRLYVNTEHPRFGHKHLDGSTAYTDESLVADPGDGFQVIITNITFGSNAATAINFFLEEGSTKIYGPYALEAVAGRGFCSGPIFLPVTASTAVTLTTSASIAQAFDMDYFIQAVP